MQIHFKGIQGNRIRKEFIYELDGLEFTVVVWLDSKTNQYYYVGCDCDGRIIGDALTAKGFPTDGTLDTYLFDYQHEQASVVASQVVEVIKRFI